MTTSTSVKKGATAKPSHPSWIDMIKDCIIAHPEDSRSGVSRSTIKKFIEAKYEIIMGASHSLHLSRAILSGSDKGIFVLPKGPSGKVKLTRHANVDAVRSFNEAHKEILISGARSEKKSSTSKTFEANATSNKRSVSKGSRTKEQVSRNPVTKAESRTHVKAPHTRPIRQSTIPSPVKKSTTGKVERLEKRTSTRGSNVKKAVARKAGPVPEAKGKAKI